MKKRKLRTKKKKKNGMIETKKPNICRNKKKYQKKICKQISQHLFRSFHVHTWIIPCTAIFLPLNFLFSNIRLYLNLRLLYIFLYHQFSSFLHKYQSKNSHTRIQPLCMMQSKKQRKRRLSEQANGKKKQSQKKKKKQNKFYIQTILVKSFYYRFVDLMLNDISVLCLYLHSSFVCILYESREFEYMHTLDTYVRTLAMWNEWMCLCV